MHLKGKAHRLALCSPYSEQHLPVRYIRYDDSRINRCFMQSHRTCWNTIAVCDTCRSDVRRGISDHRLHRYTLDRTCFGTCSACRSRAHSQQDQPASKEKQGRKHEIIYNSDVLTAFRQNSIPGGVITYCVVFALENSWWKNLMPKHIFLTIRRWYNAVWLRLEENANN